jgi:hypothetical protein
VTTCRSCGAPIRWAITPKGRRIPLDFEPARDGNVRLGAFAGEEHALVLAGAELAAAQIAGPVYRAHFSTCPNAAQHRRASRPRNAVATLTEGQEPCEPA